MKLRHILALAVITSLTSASAFAVGDAGCGLGYLVWQSKNGKLAQLSALTTNFTSYSQTFGITTGTSGCTASGLVRTDKEQEYFANVNRDALSREMAQGSGDNVAALSTLLGCSDTTGFRTFVKQNYGSIFTSQNTNGTQMLTNIKSLMTSNTSAPACNRVVANN